MLDDDDKTCGDEKIQFDDIDAALVENIKILLVPATSDEKEAVLHYLKPINGDKYIKTCIYHHKISDVYIGKYGKNSVVVVNSAPQKHKQGPVHAAIVVTKMLEKFKNIKYIVGVGVCYGMNKEKTKLGQVIVSDIICDFTNKREGDNGLKIYQRGPQPVAGGSMGNTFQPTNDISQKLLRGADQGPYICTPSLIDNAYIKKELMENRIDALAGEMEGAGIMAALEYTSGVEAIVIKGIGDWGDGKKEGTKEWKEYAARAAAYFVKVVLKETTMS